MFGWLLKYLFVYLLGGLTFLPLLLAFLYYNGKERAGADDGAGGQEDSLAGADAEEPDIKEGNEIEKEEGTGVEAYATAWITVSREYFVYPTGDSKNTMNPPLPAANDASLQQNESAYSSLYKLMSNNSGKDKEKEKELVASLNSGASDENDSTSTKKSLSNLKKYFAVLKHGNILLYQDSDEANLKHVIVVANHVVMLWPPDVPDGELFLKRSAICLVKKDTAEGFDMVRNYEVTRISPKDAFYIYSDSCTEKEDFYFALIRASKYREESPHYHAPEFDPSISAVPNHYKTNDMMDLIMKLHSSDANLQSRWLNAIIGRLFLAIQGTGLMEQYIENKLIKKLSRVKKPSFISDLRVQKVYAGDSIPFFTNLKLRDLTPEGHLVVDASVSYSGGLGVEIATKIPLNFGARFKERNVSLVLAVALQSLEGKIRLIMKPPPSNRLWYAFESMPKMRLNVEPVVSTKQITYSLVTKAIENRIREVFKETLVLPNMDDITFTSTSDQFYRGGIWKKPADVSFAYSTNKADEETLASSTDVDSLMYEPSFNEESGSTFDTASTIGSEKSLLSRAVPKNLGAKSTQLFKKTKTLMSSSTSSDLSKDSSSMRHRNSTWSIESETTEAGEPTPQHENETARSPETFASEESVSPDLSAYDVSSHIGELKGVSTDKTETHAKEESPQPPKSDIVKTVRKWSSWYFKDKARNGDAVSPDSKFLEERYDFSGPPGGTSPKPVAAPLPHNFPPELMQFLKEEELQKGNKMQGASPYGKVPDMQLPLLGSALQRPTADGKSDVQKAKKTVARKPVGSGSSETAAAQTASTAIPIPQLASTQTAISPDSHSYTPSASVSSSGGESIASTSSSRRLSNVSVSKEGGGILVKSKAAAPVISAHPASIPRSGSSVSIHGRRHSVARKKVGSGSSQQHSNGVSQVNGDPATLTNAEPTEPNPASSSVSPLIAAVEPEDPSSSMMHEMEQ